MKHRVLLAVRPRLFRESLKSVLRRSPHVEVVDAGSDPLDLFVAVRRWAPDVLIQSWPERVSESEATTPQVMDDEPRALRIITISPNGDRMSTCRRQLCLKVSQGSSLKELLGEVEILQRRTRSSWPTSSPLIPSPYRSH